MPAKCSTKCLNHICLNYLQFLDEMLLQQRFIGNLVCVQIISHTNISNSPPSSSHLRSSIEVNVKRNLICIHLLLQQFHLTKMTYLSDLTPKMRFYSVKAVGKSRYQRLILKDEKGSTMDATIYGEDIDMYNEIIQKNGEYEISNAYISRVNPNFSGHCADYQMTISGRTLVRRLDLETSSSHTSIQYRQLISIPRNPYTTVEYDLVAVVVHVGALRSIIGSHSYPVNVCQVTLTDDSIPDAVIVSMWSDLATNEAAQLAKEVDNNPIVSFTDLHASRFLGFSLTTSQSTTVGLHPTGERADTLKTWKMTHTTFIKERMAAAAETCTVNTTPLSSTIKEMISMTPTSVVYDRKIRLNVFIPDFKPENINLLFGCKACGKKSSYDKPIAFECEFCSQPSVAEPKVCFNFSGTDGSGTKVFSTYTNLAEKILQVGVNELMEMAPKNKESYQKIGLKFRTTAVCLELSPTAPATKEVQTIKWTVKDVISE